MLFPHRTLEASLSCVMSSAYSFLPFSLPPIIILIFFLAFLVDGTGRSRRWPGSSLAGYHPSRRVVLVALVHISHMVSICMGNLSLRRAAFS